MYTFVFLLDFDFVSVSRLLYEDTGSLRSRLLYDNCCGDGSCSCGHDGCGDGIVVVGVVVVVEE